MAGANQNTSENPSFYSRLTDFDIHLFRSGKHYQLHDKLGSHPVEHNGEAGCYFAVWAPSAKQVSVIGNFNYWDVHAHNLTPRWDSSGIWEGFIPGIGHGEVYKYSIETQEGFRLEKGDPFARYWEEPPKTASIIWDPSYKWKDSKWMKKRMKEREEPKPYAVYEVHMGSWKRKMEEGGRSLSYRELAEELVDYVKDMNYTHVEFMPVMEHPFYGSWGYQITGYFAPTSRYGNPQDFKFMIDALHQAGIGVILDWVPSHFPNDAHGLYKFDGTHLYEHSDPRKGFHPDWKSSIFNYGRFEVKSILISNAVFWLEEFHVDGLRVDAVASMLYLDYSRKAGEWIPNEFGGNENIEAIRFLKEMNETVYGKFPDVITIAEESTAWPGVSKPTFLGGLGFGQKWMMGWMHDTLEFFKHDPMYRRWHMNEITFSIMYAFTENFMLPLSHDEVVHGKGPLMARMPGDEWQRFANMRLMLGYMYAHPGTKLLFMGSEFAQTSEWRHDHGLEWHLLQFGFHSGVQNLVRDINKLYQTTKALYERPFEKEGFEWIDYSDTENSVIVFARYGMNPDKDAVLAVCNFTPQLHHEYRVGVSATGEWIEIFNSDDKKYSGTGLTNGSVETTSTQSHGKDQSVVLKLPPLAIILLKLKS
ncbi:1,4-alpha-glucan branching protein GlgB [Fulvivirga sedimenti]|uniref:1,4-alpha-glucan branching enzyme GlgB n=1 Tax=Fulvivirga sedimenti TaxID=2879465 RepID=A0A9X1L1Y5_9BACT|nr:1,4-alpha-glucan branching protein GlgB [Fulvivirga sedimenti]MCA6079159.1 1,4-alpha-glucan branching protein GlgB [Fulvivirga sedimenti]